jgi:hypothetical protein
MRLLGAEKSLNAEAGTDKTTTRQRADCSINFFSANRRSEKMGPPVIIILSGKFLLRSRESEIKPKAVLVVCVPRWRI